MTDSKTIKKVFISYSHDNAHHKLNALELSNQLRADGIDSMIDRYVPAPSKGWPRWMRNQISAANIIIIVCSDNYRRRYYGEEKNGKGLGANWEGLIITESYYTSQTDISQKKIIPVLFENINKDTIPIEFQGLTHIRLPNDYEQLYRLITDQPEITIPPLGSIKKLKSDEEISLQKGAVEKLSISSSGATEAFSDSELITNSVIKPKKLNLYRRNNEVFIQELRNKYKSKSLSIITGAGISLDAGLPSWNQLIKQLILLYVKRTYGIDSNEHEFSTIEKSLHNEFNFLHPIITAQFIRSRYSEDAFIELLHDALYYNISEEIPPTNTCRIIAKLSPKLKSVLTFNFDDLLERAMILANIQYTSISRAKDLCDIKGVPIFHPHGYIPYGQNGKDTNIIFAESDYHDQYLSQFNWSNIIVSNALMKNVCLFIGTSLTDPNVRRLIDAAHRENVDRVHYIITYKTKSKNNLSEQAINEIHEATYDQFGIKPIWIDDFEEVPKILKSLIQ